MDQPGESVKSVTAMEARKNFGKMLEEVYYKGDVFIIGRKGRPMAVLVPVSKLEALQKIQNQPKSGHDTNREHSRRSPKRKS
jgi:prevent-host-death family protein